MLPRKQTGSNPPLLVIRTTGSSRNGEVYIEADFPASAGPVQLVYNNARTDFSAKRYASGKTLIESGFWAMLKAAENKDMAFFLTGRRLDGTYESARYSGISPLGVISILESQCGFSSSAISAKSSADLLADERALGISSDDMRHIRWVLNRQISSRRSAPPKGSTLTSTERGYLEQYARRNGLRASRYLTPELAQSLIRRRFLPLRSPPSSKPNYRRHSDWFSYQTSDRKACVTASFATSWTGAEFYVAPMMEYGARKSTSGNAI
ncbi:MAG TPA: hypothetical protein ENK83_05445, partial [Aliiroseovarius sp.]|nr:hypothetical protein [Aliiroseovarius sp.]